MKLEYFIKKRKVFNLKSGKTEEKYIAALLQKSRITNESIYKKVEVSCTLSAPEAALAMDEISDVILFYLRCGCPVQLGKLGWLHPSLDAKAQDDPQKVDLKTVSRVKCTFQPSMAVVKALNTVPLQKVKYFPKAIK